MSTKVERNYLEINFLKDLKEQYPDESTIAEKIIQFIEEKNG